MRPPTIYVFTCLAAVLSLAACTSSGTTAPLPSAVPTNTQNAGGRSTGPSGNATSTPTLPTSGSGLGAACRGADLAGTVGFQGATQALAGDLVLTNRSASGCTLDGTPQVQLVDANGQILSIDDVTPPDATPERSLVVQPGKAAYVRLFWRNWCGLVPAFPLSVKASWPGSTGSVTTMLNLGAPANVPAKNLTPVCNAPSQNSTLSVYPFQSTP